MKKNLFFILPASLIFSIFIIPISHAEENTGTINIQQTSPTGTVGNWVLIKPGNKQISLSKAQYTLKDAPAGQYTLFATPPEGAITKIHQFIENDFLKTSNHPQISFVMDEGANMTFRIEYTFTRVGIVSVSSDPAGLEFTMVGPNNTNIQGTTPASYPNVPEGLYSVTYDPIPNCVTPKATSNRLLKDSRINFNIKIVCEGLEDLTQQQEKNIKFEYVNVIIDGESVVFQDVPSKEWFAPFVQNVLKTGIMSGYKDENGNISGEFGPMNSITLAQLLKITHKIANIDENKAFSSPKNQASIGTWFEKYMASAEKLNWLVYKDSRLNPERQATRAEVIATLLQALDVRRYWPTGTLFTDILLSTEYASCIETAALDGLIDGYDNGSFKPDDPMNRAEISKVLSQAIDLYVNEN
jgi:hypothetical protein